MKNTISKLVQTEDVWHRCDRCSDWLTCSDSVSILTHPGKEFELNRIESNENDKENLRIILRSRDSEHVLVLSNLSALMPQKCKDSLQTVCDGGSDGSPPEPEEFDSSVQIICARLCKEEPHQEEQIIKFTDTVSDDTVMSKSNTRNKSSARSFRHSNLKTKIKSKSPMPEGTERTRTKVATSIDHASEKKNGKRDGSAPLESRMRSRGNKYTSVEGLGTARIQHTCATCRKSFTTKSNLEKHLLSHTREKPHQCTRCLKTFSLMSNLRVHMRIHNDEKPHVCSECGKGFRTAQNLRQHSRTHSGAKPFLCTTCGTAFTSQSYLVVHNRLHTGERSYSCTQCPKTFMTSLNLRKHVMTHDGTRKPYECAECGKKFVDSYKLRCHQSVHSDKKMYGCDECQSSYTTNYQLQRHKRTQHVDLHHQTEEITHNPDDTRIPEAVQKCVICGDRFKTMVLLKHHMLQVHRDSVTVMNSTVNKCSTRRAPVPSGANNKRTITGSKKSHSNLNAEEEKSDIKNMEADFVEVTDVPGDITSTSQLFEKDEDSTRTVFIFTESDTQQNTTDLLETSDELLHSDNGAQFKSVEDLLPQEETEAASSIALLDESGKLIATLQHYGESIQQN